MTDRYSGVSSGALGFEFGSSGFIRRYGIMPVDGR